VEGGIKLRLTGGGRHCETASGLDHKDVRDYVTGVQAVFDGEPDMGVSDGLTHCYKADLANEVTGGVVTWLGTGIFAPRTSTLSFELTGGNVFHCVLKAMAIQNAAVELHQCKCINCSAW